MKDVLINFEAEKRDGVVAVGTYLIDAAKRLGIEIERTCHLPESEHNCGMKVSSGKELLSDPTGVEMEQLSSQARKSGERLSCQARIEKPGEVTIMSVEKQEETKTEEEETKDSYRKEFEELPLEEKISNLIELEAIALGETLSYVINSPYKAASKVMDVMAGFGLNMEKEDQESKRPEEHNEDDSKSEKEDGEDKADEAKEEKTEKKTTKKKAPSKKKPVKKQPTSEDSADDAGEDSEDK